MSTKEAPVRILLVGETRQARRLRTMVHSSHSPRIQVFRTSNLKNAVSYLSRDEVHVMLLDLESSAMRRKEYFRHARAAASEVPLIVLSDTNDEALALASIQNGAQDFLSKSQLDRATFVRALRYAIERYRVQKGIQSLSLLDDLTGLNNRRGFRTLAEQHLRLVQRKGSALLVFVDVDGLKEINDVYGHIEGNRALIGATNVLRACFRESDIIGRLGGDEFCVLMTDARVESAQNVQKRIRQQLDLSNAVSAWQFRLSLSIGIAAVPTARRSSLDDLLSLADSMMYEQKRSKHSVLSPGSADSLSAELSL